jgi:hypothetical protein
LEGTSATPVARIASSTRWPSLASESSLTGRPWQARRTPAMTLSREKGSVTPLRLLTMSSTVSCVVNLRPHAGQVRLRRIAAPSSVERLSMTLVSGWRQNGQCIADSPFSRTPGLHGTLAHALRRTTVR